MQVTLTQDGQGGSAAGGVITVVGEVDADNAEQFRADLLETAPAGDEVVVDLSGLTFIDSSGLSELLRVGNILAEDGRRLVVRDPSTPVRRVLEITGLLEHFGLSGD